MDDDPLLRAVCTVCGPYGTFRQSELEPGDDGHSVPFKNHIMDVHAPETRYVLAEEGVSLADRWNPTPRAPTSGGQMPKKATQACSVHNQPNCCNECPRGGCRMCSCRRGEDCKHTPITAPASAREHPPAMTQSTRTAGES